MDHAITVGNLVWVGIGGLIGLVVLLAIVWLATRGDSWWR
jgi:hypothetical protein